MLDYSYYIKSALIYKFEKVRWEVPFKLLILDFNIAFYRVLDPHLLSFLQVEMITLDCHTIRQYFCSQQETNLFLEIVDSINQNLLLFF